MSPEEVMNHIREDTLLNQLRMVLSGIIGQMEQESMQRQRPSIQEIRALEFTSLERLLDKAEDLGLIKRL